MVVGVLGTAVVSNVAAPAPAAAAVRVRPPAPFPTKVMGTYWMKWKEAGSPRLVDIPRSYNVIYLAFGVGERYQYGRRVTGNVLWSQSVYPSEAAFRNDLAAVRARGQRVLLSVGGANDPFDWSATGARQFVTSVLGIYNRLGGLDGIDLDLEAGTYNVPNMAWAIRTLRARIGSRFSVTMAPQPAVYPHKDLARRLLARGDLTMIAMQTYDYREPSQQSRINSFKSRIQELKRSYGIPNHKIGLTVRVHGNNGRYNWSNAGNFWTIPGTVAMQRQMAAAFPGFKGQVLWEVAADRRNGYRYLKTLAPVVLR